ncbi:MAG: type II toxin-antitoxin system VapC family toxin [Chloroflexi bacterium]|nr:type II toxin-antitoxin system VapC family toxin [Chloroflexota bacterium]
MKILDTDHCIAILRGRIQLSDHISPAEALAVTSVSVGELMHGALKSSRAAENLLKLEVLLAGMVILPFDEGAAYHFGQLKAGLERKGERLPDIDLQIASIALLHQIELFTHNQRHFRRIPGLMLNDWLA